MFISIVHLQLHFVHILWCGYLNEFVFALLCFVYISLLYFNFSSFDIFQGGKEINDIVWQFLIGHFETLNVLPVISTTGEV
jgi:hypothetical protein